MKVNTFGRLALTAGIIGVAASGLVATPASADPSPLYANNLVGFGSDTTQDVMQRLAETIGGDKLASFHASYTAPLTDQVTVRTGGPSNVPRAKGSGDGFAMLKVAEGALPSSDVKSFAQTFSAVDGTRLVGQIDYARASSVQGTQNDGGEFVNIPFATDIVGIAVDPDDPISKIPLSIGTSTDAATVPSLQSIYRCTAKYVYTGPGGMYIGVGATSSLPPGADVATEIKPQLPGYGSGTAAFFIKALFGATDSASWANSYTCISRVSNALPIAEHDGAPIDAVDNAIGIYSIGQWVAQFKSATTLVTDKTNGTTLMSIASVDGGTAIAPTTGSAATLAPNADAWHSAFKRLVYNVVATRKATDPNSAIRTMFVGNTSLVCQNTAAISALGFAPLTPLDGGDPTSNANSCGSINVALRTTNGNNGVNMTTPASVTNVADVNALTTAVGRSFIVSVNGGVATHDQGGQVQILDQEYGASNAHVLGSATVAAGQSVPANVTVTPVATGTTKMYAYFIPKLGAIKVTNMSPVSELDKSFASITPTNATTTKLSIRKPAKIGGTVRVVAWVDAGGAFDGGTVTLYKDTVSGAVLATDTLAAGETGAVLNYVQSITSQTIIAKFTPTNSSAVTSTSAAATVTLSKETPSVTWSALPAAPNGLAVVTGSGTDYVAAKTIQVTAAAATVNAANEVVTTTTAHGLAKGDVVYLSAGTGTALPTGITAGTKYYVIPASGTTVTGSTFKLSATLNGGALNFTGTPPAVKIWKQNVAPKVTLTIAAPAGVTLKPSGAIKVYIGTISSDKSQEISSASTGLTLANGTLTATLSKADLWTGLTSVGKPGTTTPSATRYLIVEYPGDTAFNTVTVFKSIKVTP